MNYNLNYTSKNIGIANRINNCFLNVIMQFIFNNKNLLILKISSYNLELNQFKVTDKISFIKKIFIFYFVF